MSWIEVRARFEPAPQDWSPVAEVFRVHGIENTLEDRNELVGCISNVDSAGSSIESLQDALVQLGAQEVRVGELEEVDWEIAWRQFFHPRRVGRRFVIRPTWEEFEPETGDLVIVLDPGQAFGTGDHPTTRMCLQLLEVANVDGKKVVDVGCGSGILSLGAHLLGAATVIATDIDPIAVDVARENAKLNRVHLQFTTSAGFEALDGPFDVVVSNIISATLIRVAPDAAAVLASGGKWIVSGIILENWPDVLAAAETAGFELTQKLEEDGWVAAMLARVS